MTIWRVGIACWIHKATNTHTHTHTHHTHTHHTHTHTHTHTHRLFNPYLANVENMVSF